ncbi:MAG: class I SAM-dependent methyltransferase [Gemmatimonadales bacterium]
MKAFADHFSAISADYATYRPRYPEGLFTALAGAVSRRTLAWDCATGTGQAAVQLARWFDRVVASDASASQVRQGEGCEPVSYIAATAERVPLRAGSADLITVAQALHWIELDQFYAEARRVLAPGGLLAVWTYGRHWVDGGVIDQQVGHFYEQVVGPYWPPERRWVEAGYAGLPFPFEKVPLTIPPMAEEWTLAQMLGYISTWSAVVRYTRENGMNPVPALAERLGPHWETDRPRRIEWTLTLLAGK